MGWLVASLPCWKEFLGWGCIPPTVIVPYSLEGWGQSKPPLRQQLSALGMAHWIPNKLAVAPAGAGGAGLVLPESQRWNDPSSVHPRLSGC